MRWFRIVEPLFNDELPGNGQVCLLGDSLTGIVTMGFINELGQFVMMSPLANFEEDSEPTHFMEIPPLPEFED